MANQISAHQAEEDERNEKILIYVPKQLALLLKIQVSYLTYRLMPTLF